MQIHVVDDEACWREALTLQLRGTGHPVRAHADGESLADGLSDTWPNCILLDWHLGPERGGDVLRALPSGHTPRTVVVMSGDGEAETVVAAMRAGAHDFVVKDRGLAAFARCVADAGERLAGERLGGGRPIGGRAAGAPPGPADRAAATLAVTALSAREREVLQRVAAGVGTKSIAHAMGLSPRTIEMHRARLRERLAVGSMHEAVGLWRLAGA